MSDTMYGPGDHEDAAMLKLNNDRPEDAQVRATLAVASAINRLAAAVEVLAEKE